jgi:O-6-methylguanine DNA methyltransferase
MKEVNYICRMESPLGELLLVEEEERLIRLLFSDDGETRSLAGAMKMATGSRAEKPTLGKPLIERRTPLLEEAVGQLRQYFAGERQSFDLPLRLEGTEFQKKVWNELQKIPYGTTISYRELAMRAGSPGGCRAAGGANHRNPIPIIVPCHRVIGADGKLTGYGGGLPRKEKLLAIEQKYVTIRG